MNLKLDWLAKFKQKNTLDLIKLFLFFFIIFTFSLNLFYKLTLAGAYVHGLLIDYLIPKIYLFELFLLPFLVIEFVHLRKFKTTTYLSLLILILIIRQFFSQNALASLLYLIHLGEALLFFCCLRYDPLFKSKMAKQFAAGAMLSVIVFQSALAFYQFIFQKSFLSYQFLGETNLHDLTNVSKGQFFLAEKILPYASTPHPNILAGLIVILSILVWQKIPQLKGLRLLLLTNALLIIFLTQSVSALLTLILFAIYRLYLHGKVKPIWIILIYYFFLLFLPYGLEKMTKITPYEYSIDRRVMLNQASLDMFKQQMLFGTGLNNFTLNLEKYARNQEVIRFVQPVHHLLLLILSEGGLLFLIILLLLKKDLQINNFAAKTLILLGIASLDHYLLTQVSGLSLLVLFYWFI